MEIIFHSRANKTHFHKKCCAPSLILKVRVFGTRKWPINTFIALPSGPIQRTLTSSSSKRSRTLQPGLPVVPQNLTTLLRFWKNYTGYLFNLSFISVTPCLLYSVWLHCSAPNFCIYPYIKIKSGQRTFFYRTVSLWNSLDNSLKRCNSTRNF